MPTERWGGVVTRDKFNQGAAWQRAMTGVSMEEAAAGLLQYGGQVIRLEAGERVMSLDSRFIVRCLRRHPHWRPWWSYFQPHRVGYRRCACGRRWAWDAGQWHAYGDPEPGTPPAEPAGASSTWEPQRSRFVSPAMTSVGTILSDATPAAEQSCPCPAGPLDCMGCDRRDQF